MVRLCGGTASPLECLFRDAFVRLAKTEAAAQKLAAADAEALGKLRTSYSELAPASVQRLLAAVPLEPGEVFVDLGAGLGKVAMQAALAQPVSARGVELAPPRLSGGTTHLTLLVSRRFSSKAANNAANSISRIRQVM